MGKSTSRRRFESPAKRVPNKLDALRQKNGVAPVIDYKDTALLRQFLTDRGKIRSRRVTGLTPQQQRQVATAIRNAREMALLPYSSGR
ncbi:30S ribosomal protein S18 [Gordonia araii NBRC 100433]|uniref:Small ribosomal subunit protein bS18 n=1 Tax=Gordonia araii NBRC 100433 TaxID=1073574 RepID=G7GX38_9ACTN|nr:30S ribosomal protein S18 [Gordonia araii]NNG98206.1 30S ribosomal protein S18 [Gordonia araii NBRC 100433]GAB08163.1 30S ribosomal protein S18 [Gordonia araii NBRC 100433]